MELENKVMRLYEDVLEPVKARKIVLLLKYVIIDGETDLDIIKREIPISEATLVKYVSDDELMLKYLNQEKLTLFREKIDKVLNKHEKLRRLIDLVLVKNEKDIEKIQRIVPISLETIKKYLRDKELLSKYLTEEEIKIFSDRLENTQPKIQRLIKAVLVDGINNIEELEKKAYIKVNTIKKHLENPSELKKHLDDNQMQILESRLRKMIGEWENRKEKEEVTVMEHIIDDVFHTRYLCKDICEKNFSTYRRFETYLHDEEFMKKHFREGIVEEVNSKIAENESLRKRVPRDCFVIEDRFCVMIARKDIHYLNQFDTKRLNFVSEYFGTGANLDAVMKKYETSLLETLALLSSSNMKQILAEEYYSMLKQYLEIENIILGSDLSKKKEFTSKITEFLEQNNYDIELAMKYFRIPEALFNKILCETIRLPYASLETKEALKAILNIDIEKKQK